MLFRIEISRLRIDQIISSAEFRELRDWWVFMPRV